MSPRPVYFLISFSAEDGPHARSVVSPSPELYHSLKSPGYFVFFCGGDGAQGFTCPWIPRLQSLCEVLDPNPALPPSHGVSSDGSLSSAGLRTPLIVPFPRRCCEAQVSTHLQVSASALPGTGHSTSHACRVLLVLVPAAAYAGMATRSFSVRSPTSPTHNTLVYGRSLQVFALQSYVEVEAARQWLIVGVHASVIPYRVIRIYNVPCF